MACATLKRPVNWDPLVGGPHSLTPRAAKRARRSLASMTSVKHHHHYQQQLQIARDVSSSADIVSPFLNAAPKLTSELIAESVCNEVRRLQRRKQLPSFIGVTCGMAPSAATLTAASASNLEVSSVSASPSSSVGSSTPNASTGPLFTFKQVNLICERMLREREEELRQHYDRVLNDKLAEQYDAFVRFTQDQIHRKFADDRSGVPSYCS